MNILIVEDEANIANGLQFNFEQEGYHAQVAGDGATALDFLKNAAEPFDLVVLDLMLPGMSGYETCQKIREFDDQIPVLVLSARTLSEDKSLAFDVGTDQYMTKPFALPELLSRVRNLLRRHSRATTRALLHDFRFGDVEINFDKFEVTVDGTTHKLTTMEAQLLRYFVEHEGKVLSRARIMKDVWDQSADITTRSIDNFVMRLRKFVEKNPAVPRHLLSIRGTGYRFVSRPDAITPDEAMT